MSQHRVVRLQGLCYGSLYKEHKDGKETNRRSRSLDFCVLVGNSLLTYESFHAFRRGDFPLSDVRIVGASSWSPSSKPSHQNLMQMQHAQARSRSVSPLRTDTSTFTPSVGTLAASFSSTAASMLFGEPSSNLSFRIITFAGTHIDCVALSSYDKDTWLASIMAGLHVSISGYSEDPNSSTHNHLPLTTHQLEQLQLYESNKLQPPASRLTEEPVDYASLHPILQTIVTSPTQSFTSSIPLTYCTSCGKLPPQHINRPNHLYGFPLLQYGMENKVSTLCYPCLIAQGVLRHVMNMVDLYAADTMDRAALAQARQLVLDNINARHISERHSDTDNMITRLLVLLQTPTFVTLRRRSQKLDQSCLWLEQRVALSMEELYCCVIEFVDVLNQLNGVRSTYPPNQQIGNLKKEALKVAGDMGTAIKLLYEYAIPQGTSENLLGSGDSHFISHGSASTEMFSSILDFFLDLCREGEMASVAFYWPQICQIHLQMLPAIDVESLSRVELMEDFLITVSTKYSIHLALELIWNSIADLEESLGFSRDIATASCRRRKFALLRFVSELESYIFDFEGGWGGGSISLRGLLTPSEDQGTLIRTYMGHLQLYRRLLRYNLSCSTRLVKLRRESRDPCGERVDSVPFHDLNDEQAHAITKGNLARNAEYFHSQIIFNRRLGDIAEKLRYLDVEARIPTLHYELDLLNSSGRLGGDPINKIAEINDPSLINVLHIPIRECHVFRSKARTPLLLLMELEREGSTDSTQPILESHADSELPCPSLDQGMVDMTISSNVPSLETASSADLIHSDQVISLHRLTASEHTTLIPDLLDISPLTPRRRLASSSEPFTPYSVETVVTKIIYDKLNCAIPQLAMECNDDDGEDVEEIFHDAAATAVSDEACCELQDVTPTPDKRVVLPPEEDNFIETSTRPVGQQKSSLILEEAIQPYSTPFLGKMKRTGIKDVASRSFNAYGEGRRQVLKTIFMKGMKSPNVIARRVAPAAQRAAQAIDTHIAVKLLLKDRERRESRDYDNISCPGSAGRSYEDSKEYALSLALKASMEVEEEEGNSISFSPSTSDECMESLRLLLIRDRVARGSLTLEGAAQALCTSHIRQGGYISKNSSTIQQGIDNTVLENSGDVVDAGDLDDRLSGCGLVGPAIASSIQLWKDGVITDMELLDLVQKDTVFSRLSFPGKENESKLLEDSAFWEKFAFGELWAQKKARIRSSSRFGKAIGWDLCGVIVKSNDDVRQEAFVMQLIELCKEIFDQAGLDVWVQPYRILATSKSTGIIEMVRNAMSIDSLKKLPGFHQEGLLGHFKRIAQVAADPEEALMSSKRNFVRSLAAYSLISYMFNIKDRHNGNLLLDSSGHIIHIDFGFVFGIAPGGSFSLEQSVPFKLTDEMVQVMDGVGSKLFLEFLMLFCCGFVALQMHADTFLTLVEITCVGSTFKCFEGRDYLEILDNLRSRFCLNLDKESTILFAMDLIHQAITSYGTARYDFFQYISNGIAV